MLNIYPNSITYTLYAAFSMLWLASACTPQSATSGSANLSALYRPDLHTARDADPRDVQAARGAVLMVLAQLGIETAEVASLDVYVVHEPIPFKGEIKSGVTYWDHERNAVVYYNAGSCLGQTYLAHELIHAYMHDGDHTDPRLWSIHNATHSAETMARNLLQRELCASDRTAPTPSHPNSTTPIAQH